MISRFRSNSFKAFTTILGGAFLCIVIAGCKNFLNSGEVQKEIKDAIAYNNAKSVNIVISCPQEMGTVYPNNTYTAKLGYDFELQFKPNTKDYCIKDLSTVFEAVRYNDDSVSLSDYVEFKAIERTQEDERDGLYRVNAKVIKEASDILIRPKCLLLPEITGIQTNMTNGILSPGNPVTVVFNMPVDSNTLNYTNISIKANGSDISRLFESPQLYENILTIKPKYEQLSEYIEKILLLKNLEVTFEFRNTITSTNEGITLPLKQNNYSTFKVIYNSEIERNAPVCNVFFMTAEPISLENASVLNNSKYFLTQFANKSQKLKNRTKNYVYLYGIYNDAESGIRLVKVKSRKTHGAKGERIQEIYDEDDYYTSLSDSQFKIADNGNVSFCIQYELKHGDGTYIIETIVEDGSGNQVGQGITVFKETSLHGNTNVSNKIIRAADVQTYNEALKTLELCYKADWDPQDPGDSEFPNFLVKGPDDIEYPLNECTVKCLYAGRNGTPQAPVFVDAPDEYLSYQRKECVLDVETVAELFITIVVENDIGNQYVEKYIIPSKCKVLPTEDEYSWTGYDFSSSMGDGWPQLFKVDEEENNEIRALGPNADRLFEDITYYASVRNGNLFGPLSDSFTKTYVAQEEPKIVIDNHNYEKATDNSNNYYITLTVAPAEWNNYDSIYICNVYENSQAVYFDKNTNKCRFLTSNDFANKSLTVKVYGEKNTNVFEYYYCIPQFTSIQNDQFAKTPPFVDIEINDNIAKFIFADAGSGIAGAKIEYCNKPAADSSNFEDLEFNEGDIIEDDCYYDYLGGQIEAYIPLWKIAEAGGIMLYARDKVNNEMIPQYYFPDLNCYGGIYYRYHNEETDKWIYGVSYWEEIHNYKLFRLAKWNGYVSVQASDSHGIFVEDPDVNIVASELFDTTLWQSNSKEFEMFNLYTSSEGFYRIRAIGNYYVPLYFYSGYHTGTWDFFHYNKENKQSMLVRSDAPVYVCTYSANCSYEECVNWGSDTWGQFKRTTSEKLIEFGQDDHDYKNYTIDLTKIPCNYYYVVVAYFADGKKMMSCVYQKDW